MEVTPINDFQAVLPPDQVLEAMNPVEQKQALKKIALSIREALSSSSPAASVQEPSDTAIVKDSVPPVPPISSHTPNSSLPLREGNHWRQQRIPTEVKVHENEPAGTNPSTADLTIRTIGIFLVSSSEPEKDRDAFNLHFRQENDRVLKQRIHLEIVRCENFLDAMSEIRLQNEYNKAVRSCDIFASLLKTKTGKQTGEEFDVAHRAFKNSGKSLIYTRFMRTQVPTDQRRRDALNSLWAFQEKLSKLGHYYTEHTSIEDLRFQFRRQLDKLIEEDKI